MKDDVHDAVRKARRELDKAIKYSNKNVMLNATIELEHAKVLLELADSYIAVADKGIHDKAL